MHKYSLFLHIITFSLGAVGGYHVGKYVTRCKYEELFAVELKHIEEYYVGAHPEKPRRDQSSGQSTVEMHPITEEYVKPEKVDYTSYAAKPRIDEDDEEDTDDYSDDQIALELESAKMEEEYNKLRQKPTEVIDEESYGDIELFSTVELLYYQYNDILTIKEAPNKESIIDFDELEDYLGDVLVSTQFKFDDEDELFVRNYHRMTDYRIDKVFGAFGED